MDNSVLTRTVTVQHDEGLHARPAQLIASAAMRFDSRVELICNENRVDAKSILSVLTLGARQGTEVRIEVSGDDATEAAEAIETLAKLVESDFPADKLTSEPS